ncbi:hypothetical protein DFAR_3000021 [Desulfarculales bacterium]
MHQSLNPVLEKLLRLGDSTEYMLELATEFNDRLSLKILELSELEMEGQGPGRAPMPYAWLALGSASRLCVPSSKIAWSTPGYPGSARPRLRAGFWPEPSAWWNAWPTAASSKSNRGSWPPRRPGARTILSCIRPIWT